MQHLYGYDYTQHPRLARESIRFLFHSDYYDGPLSGMAVYQNNEYWFDCVRYEDNRIFLLLKLDEEDLRERHARHAAFVMLVGEHSSYDEFGKCLRGETKGTWRKFYEMYQDADPTLTNYSIIGYFYLYPDAEWLDFCAKFHYEDDDE